MLIVGNPEVGSDGQLELDPIHITVCYSDISPKIYPEGKYSASIDYSIKKYVRR